MYCSYSDWVILAVAVMCGGSEGKQNGSRRISEVSMRPPGIKVRRTKERIALARIAKELSGRSPFLIEGVRGVANVLIEAGYLRIVDAFLMETEKSVSMRSGNFKEKSGRL
jgi:hypothetical protein